MKKYFLIAALLILMPWLALADPVGDSGGIHGGGGGASVSDTAYNATSWDNVTDAAPSKNAVRDKFEALHATGGDTALGVLGTKNPPIDADKVIYRDSTASDAVVTSTWTQIKAFLKTYFDGVYAAVLGANDNYVTDTEKAALHAAETAASIGAIINGATLKATPVDADKWFYYDSVGATGVYISYAALKALLWATPTIIGQPSISAGAGNGGGVLKLLEDPNNGTDYSSVTGAADAGTYPSFTWGGSQGAEAFTMTLGSNSVTYSSSTGITSISLSAINLATTGTVSGGSLTPVIDDPDNFAANFTGANLYGGTFIANAAGTAALPAVAVGMNFTVILEGANAVILNPDGGGTADTITMNGLAAAQDENITSSTSGAICTFQYRAADSWMATCNGFAEATPP